MYLSVNNLLTFKERRKLIAPISRAYTMAETILEIDNLKDQPIIKNIASMFKHTLVEYELKKVIDSGLIDGVRCEYSNNRKHTHPFLELIGDNFKITINHVRKSSIIPTNTYYRNSMALTNQTTLFDNELDKTEQLYGIITHGHIGPRPEFICFGIPSYNMRSWEDQINMQKESNIVVVDNSVETLREIESISKIAQTVVSENKDIMVSYTELSKLIMKRSEGNDGK